MKKDIKKSSYYVWFLGAEEAKGLRGSEYMIPVVRNLVEREKEVEPYKVTLQVSHKGLKIIQNIPINSLNCAPVAKVVKGNSKTEVIKHFIPHHAVTSVLQEEDIVSCILLLYNPYTKCPVHVHAYRCDSIETAEILCGQLQTLIERPENQKKLEEIESRLKAKGLILSNSNSRSGRKIHSPTSGSSDGRNSSARESDLSGGSSGSDRLSGDTRIANLYDSLAAELKEKLNVSQQNQAPLLLPPRDYDTVHRQKGNFSGIDFRRCLNMNIVGINASKNKRNLDLIPNHLSAGKQQITTGSRTKIGSSGGSSGIGSDHAPSPDQECDVRYLDNQSTSDEDWNADQLNGNSLFLVQTGQHDWQSKEMSLPRARRHNSSGFESSSIPSPSSPNGPTDVDMFKKRPEDDRYHSQDLTVQKSKKLSQSASNDYDRKQKFLEEIRSQKQKFLGKLAASKSDLISDSSNNKKRSPEDRQRSPSPVEVVSPKERFKDAKEKFLLLERERLEEQERLIQMNTERKKNPANHDLYPNVSKPKSSKRYSKNREVEDDFVDRTKYNMYRQASLEEDYKHDIEKDAKRRLMAKSAYYRNKSMESLNSEEYPSLASSGNGHKNYENSFNLSRSRLNSSYQEEDKIENYNRMSRYHSSEIPDHTPARRRHASPLNSTPKLTPRSYSEDYLPEHTNGVKYRENVTKSHQSVPFAEETAIPLQRYRSPTRMTENSRPTSKNYNYPIPSPEEENSRRITRSDSRYHSRINDDVEGKRRVLETIEDTKRRNSNEIAKELKRRSYQDHRTTSELSYQYHETEDQDRYPTDREMPRLYHNKIIRNGRCSPPNGQTPSASPRYRHSYAEPFHHHSPQVPHHHDILHRTNSSVSSGRIGIAAIHHY